jgi:hypothetical protein
VNFVEVDALSHFVAPVLGSLEQARSVRQQSCTFKQFAASMQF